MIPNSKVPQIVSEIRENGFAVIENALSPAQVERITQIIDKPLEIPAVNGRKGYVQFGCRRFVANPLIWGREMIDVYTRDELVQIGDQYIREPVHLSYFRVYRTFPSKHEVMHWHIDNKVDSYDSQSEKFTTKMLQGEIGLSFIYYLTDVEIGGFEIVKGSHLWSQEGEGWKKESWDDVQHRFKKEDVFTLNHQKKGTLLLFDYRSIHRAQPFSEGAPRLAILGQYFPLHIAEGEPILLNSRDLAHLTDVQKRVLGFGLAPTSENWPIGSEEELFDLKDWMQMGVKLVKRRSKEALKNMGVLKTL